MWTALRQWVARLRWAWAIAPHMPWLAQLSTLRTSQTYTGAVFGVHKCGLDVSLKAAHNEHLRAEAIEWAGHWYKEHGLAPHPWDVRLCVELAVGQLKGYLLN
jgi:hypothetical protein